MPESNELSERELEILCLVATGASNKEIAQKLFISSNTVKVHLRNIFAKISVASRTEAAMYAVNAGLVQSAVRVVEEPQIYSAELQSTENGNPPAAIGDAAPRRAEPSNRTKTYLGIASLSIILVLAVGFLALRNRQPVATPPAASLPSTPVTRWQKLAQMSMARSNLAVTTYENMVYAIAGRTGEGITALVERYDPSMNSWQSLADKPTAVEDVSAVTIGGKIYVPGGRLASGLVTDRLEIYDPRQGGWEEGAPLPAAASAYALAAFEGKLYLFGGWDGQRYLASVYEYNPELDSWSEKTLMRTARGYAGAVAAGGKIYVVGGKDAENILALNEAYLPDRDPGPESPWEGAAPLPAARSTMGMTGVADIVYLVGGEAGPGEDGEIPALVYFPQSDEWQSIEGPAPVDRVGAGLGLVALGPKLYAIGGVTEASPTAQNLAFQAIYTITIPVIVK